MIEILQQLIENFNLMLQLKANPFILGSMQDFKRLVHLRFGTGRDPIDRFDSIKLG